VVIKTRVRTTSETGDTEVQNQRHRVRHVRKVGCQFDIPTMWSDTSTEMVSHHIQLKLPATTRHYRFFSDDRDLGTHGHGKQSLTETNTPDFISTVSPDLSQPTHRLKEEDIIQYDCKDVCTPSQSQVNVGDSPRLRSQDDVSQQQGETPLSLP
jgi:hypothetical protein